MTFNFFDSIYIALRLKVKKTFIYTGKKCNFFGFCAIIFLSHGCEKIITHNLDGFQK